MLPISTFNLHDAVDQFMEGFKGFARTVLRFEQEYSSL